MMAKAWNVQRRRSIGHLKPTTPPASLDYDSWVGPAPMVPFQENRIRGWQWWRNFGTGDMGNDGVHDIDYCRWGLGVETHPNAVAALGGKYFFDDDQEFPDTQHVVFEYSLPESRKKMLVYEQRLWSRNPLHGVDSGVEFYGTEGQLFLSRRGKAELRDHDNKKVDLKLKLGPQDTDSHVRNFCAAVRGEEVANAEISVGHLTTALCHLGNLATEFGRTLRFDPAAERVLGDDETDGRISRTYRDHWGRPEGV
jgi:predicted dehydrogenase